MPNLTIIICAHNPRKEHLQPTLESIRSQNVAYSPDTSQFLLIDNASDTPLSHWVDLSWHPNAQIIREEKLGLTHARIRSFYESSGDILLYVDDDNILDNDYVSHVITAFEADAKLGAIGGKAIPRYETSPPEWFDELGISLACRDLGSEALYEDWTDGKKLYPACAPIGAGMAIRRAAYAKWVDEVTDDVGRSSLGRRGKDLASGEDNDMILTVLGQGWKVAYLPQLSLEHLIPSNRVQTEYLERYVESSNRTWVQVLDVHGIRPWPAIPRWTLPFRRLKAWLTARAWESDKNRVRWKKACGLLSGQAKLDAHQ